jgi:O-antigen/teichoic acid export membrane protein
MSTIRRQSIISSFVVYFGFVLGFFNTYLFTRQGGFSREEYGLTAVFIAIAQLMFAISNVGMSAYITKFFPYYKAHVTDKKNDQLTWALLLPCLGFGLVLLIGLVFKDTIINKVFDNSPELLHYYYWLFPFGFGFTIFMILEAYAWQQRKAVLSNFLREVGFRLIVTVLIVLTTFNIIKNFEVFISLFSFGYLILVGYLLFHFYKSKQLHFTFTTSHVTKRFKKKIKALVYFVWSGGLVFSLSSVIDTIVIAAVLPNGIAVAAIFTFAQNISSLIQAPQRAIASASMGPLSQAWKDKDFKKLNKIYHRSSINQLLFSCAMFSLIWLNFNDGIETFNLQPEYKAAQWIFLYLGLTRIIDMGFGLNAQIISTSTYWRFEFKTGMLLLALSLPLNYFFAIKLGVAGPAIANLISFVVYNVVRYYFLLRKFNMQPFDNKTGYTLLLSAICFLTCYLLLDGYTGLPWMIIRSLLFIIPFLAGMLWLRLSPDVVPVWQTLKKKLRLN